MKDIIYEYTNIEASKSRYLKGCLKIGMDVGSAIDRRNCEKTLDYITELEIAVIGLHHRIEQIESLPS